VPSQKKAIKLFDPTTAELLRKAPSVPDLEAAEIPQILTRQYASLVSKRLRGVQSSGAKKRKSEWPLERIADTYEIIASVTENQEDRKAAAFVSATAHQIMGRQLGSAKRKSGADNGMVSRDHIDPHITSSLLFLVAEQYADAFEASKAIKLTGSRSHKRLILTLKQLCSGRLDRIYEETESEYRPERDRFSLEENATTLLYDALRISVEMIAAELLARPYKSHNYTGIENARQLILSIEELAGGELHKFSDYSQFIGLYTGPRHLASLLKSALDGISEASLSVIKPPDGANVDFWKQWISFRAAKFPFVWPNHRTAIEKGFLDTGKSAVMVLPTGAGKTTVSALKIAGVLARGKKVIFLAPTHALVDQLTTDLQEMFPEELLGSIVSNDFDQLMLSDSSLSEIEVMTPERCLAMLSFAPEAFSDAGLLVFDECHLLSPSTGKIRRALDAMFCVLFFAQVVPDADFLFMSAMLKNGEDFSDWVSNLTNRDSVFVELMWKPSRQARGVIYYKSKRLDKIKNMALSKQRKIDAEKGKAARSLRAPAKRLLKASPHAVWGLQHNWLKREEGKASCSFSRVLPFPVQLGDSYKNRRLRITPNANEVAAQIAAKAAQSRVKTIIFVNNKQHAVSTANKVSSLLPNFNVDIPPNEQELWDALEAELGNLKHSIHEGPSIAVPHNAAMLPLERLLSERMYRRNNGANVIVATPTLAQGLNLPADLAILAGDKRANIDGEGRESLAAHEILNAAGRAGRAGHVANGIVLLIHDKIIEFDKANNTLNSDMVKALQSILPEDDRCIEITDPLTNILDRIMDGEALDEDVQYTVNRIPGVNVESEVGLFKLNLKKSFGAYIAKKEASEAKYASKIEAFEKVLNTRTLDVTDTDILSLAAQSGLPTSIVDALVAKLQLEAGSLPTNVGDWLAWGLSWLKEDEMACDELLHEIYPEILVIAGHKKNEDFKSVYLDALLPGLRAWIEGKPLNEIEIALGGQPDEDKKDYKCPRARELIGKVIPRGLSYTLNLISQAVIIADSYSKQKELDSSMVESMSTLLRRGYHTIGLLNFAATNKGIRGRVKQHKAYQKTIAEMFGEIV